MGDCSYCGKPAGLFRSKHSECATQHEQGIAKMTLLIRSAVVGESSLDALKAKLPLIARESQIKEADVSERLVSGWEGGVEHFLDDGNLSADEEKNLVAFIDRFQLSRDILDRNGSFTRLVKAAVIRDLLEGRVPNRIKIDKALPFNLQKSEKLIWVMNNVDYLEDRAKTEYKGGSQGVSVRIMKGVYYRVGAYKGQAVSRTERLHVDTGILGVTTKHLYFAGPRKSFRIRFDNIVSFNPYSDGVGIVRDAAIAKPQIFVTGDGWFLHNLLANVSRLELESAG